MLEGFSVVALDCFGDCDTRRVASRWQPIGSAARLRIDETLLLDTLQVLAERDEARGWIAGSGFDGRPESASAGRAAAAADRQRCVDRAARA